MNIEECLSNGYIAEETATTTTLRDTTYHRDFIVEHMTFFLRNKALLECHIMLR